MNSYLLARGKNQPTNQPTGSSDPQNLNKRTSWKRLLASMLTLCFQRLNCAQMVWRSMTFPREEQNGSRRHSRTGQCTHSSLPLEILTELSTLEVKLRLKYFMEWNVSASLINGILTDSQECRLLPPGWQSTRTGEIFCCGPGGWGPRRVKRAFGERAVDDKAVSLFWKGELALWDTT